MADQGQQLGHLLGFKLAPKARWMRHWWEWEVKTTKGTASGSATYQVDAIAQVQAAADLLGVGEAIKSYVRVVTL